MYNFIFDSSLNNSFEIDNFSYSENIHEIDIGQKNEISLEVVHNVMKTLPYTDEEENKNYEDEIRRFQIKNNLLPEFYTLKKIKDLLHERLSNDILKLFKKSSFENENLEKIEISISDKALLCKKRKKKSKRIPKEKERQILGRKVKDDFSIRKHNKYSSDNIIKKIKRELFECFLKFVNKIINENLDSIKKAKYRANLRPIEKRSRQNKNENLLKIINYKYIDRLNKKIDLSLLNMPFKELFSKEVSPRFSNVKPDSNKIVIKQLLEEERDNDNIIFALNLKFKDWLDVFSYKKEINSLQNFNNEKMKNIIDSFEYINSIISDIYKTNRDNNYINYYLLYLYNYERWFLIKKDRIRKNKKD